MSDIRFLENIIKDIAISQNIGDYEIKIGNSEEIGKNYFGNLIPVIVNEKEHGETKELQLLIKNPPNNDYLRNSGAIEIMFNREIFVYTKLLPAYERIQETITLELNEDQMKEPHQIQDYVHGTVEELETKKFNINHKINEERVKQEIDDFRFNWPKCYYVRETVQDEMLVLQDMRAEGYKLCHEMFFDLEHTLSSVRTIGKFHALSIILEKTHGEEFERCSRICRNFICDDGFSVYIELLKMNAELTSKIIAKDLGAILEKLCKDVHGIIQRATDKARFKVIGHGDTWKNNILFKYEDNHKITACLVDYQLTQSCSPAFDLMYLITTTTDRNLRQTAYDTILKAYYETLRNMIKHFNIDHTDVFTFEDLKTELKMVAPACLIIGNNAFKNWCGLDEGDIFKSKTDDLQRATELYKNIIEDLVNDFKEYGYFD